MIVQKLGMDELESFELWLEMLEAVLYDLCALCSSNSVVCFLSYFAKNVL